MIFNEIIAFLRSPREMRMYSSKIKDFEKCLLHMCDNDEKGIIDKFSTNKKNLLSLKKLSFHKHNT